MVRLTSYRLLLRELAAHDRGGLEDRVLLEVPPVICLLKLEQDTLLEPQLSFKRHLKRAQTQAGVMVGREGWDKGGSQGQLQAHTNPQPDFPRVVAHMALHLHGKL